MSSVRWKLAMAMCSVALFGSVPAAMAAPPSPAASERANQIGSFEVLEGAKGTMIRIKGTSVPTFSVFKLSDPPRLFVDISNSALKGDAGEMTSVDNGVISQVAMISVSDGGQDLTRIIIGFDRAAHYDVRTEGNDVVVFIDGSARRAPSSEKADAQAAVSAANAELVAQRERFAKADAELVAQRERYATADAELKRTRASLSTTEQELEQLRSRLKSAKASERADLERQIGAKNDTLSRVKSERDLAVKNLDVLRGERADALAQAKASEARAQELERREAVAITDARQAKQRELEALGKADVLKKDLERVESTRLELESKLGSSQQQAAQAAAQLEKKRTQLTTTQQRVDELEQELTSLRTLAGKGDSKARSAITSLERERSERAKELSKAQAELETTRKDIDAARAHSKSMEQSVARRDQEIQELKARIELAEQARIQERAQKESLPVARAVPVDPAIEPNVVRDIRLETRDGRSRIVVALDRPGRFETMPGRDSRAVMILNDVELPRALEKTLSSSAQGGAVRFVSSFVDGKHVRMEAELNGMAAETIRNEGNQLVWEFAPTVAAQGAPLQADASPKRPTAGDSVTSAPPMVVTDPTKVSRVPGMSRKRLTIDLRGADIQNVLRLIAKEGGVNIIAGQDVKGTVTMRLRSVPLEQVFLTVLQSQSLGFEMRGNVIRVAPQEKIIGEEKVRAELRAANQRAKPLEVFLVPVNYATAGDLTGQVQGMLSTRGSVSVDERTNTLIIKDISENLESIRVLVESLDAQVPQVLIEARIVETNDTFTKQIGIQWGGDFSFSQANGNPTGLIFPSVLGVGGGATDNQTPTAGTSQTPNFAVNLPAPVGTGSGGGIGLTMGSVGGAVNLNLRLTALEAAGHARIVSSPKILTLDNREASISQGTSIPISVVSAAGVQTAFVEARLELRVTPHVTPDGNIQLKIQANKNEPDFQNTGASGDPTIIRRQAETELLIKDGDTTVIGGIYTRNAGSNLSAVPFFHKIPILGFLFKTSVESERRAELLIFITPRIVNRAESLGVINTGSVRGQELTPEAGN